MNLHFFCCNVHKGIKRESLPKFSALYELNCKNFKYLMQNIGKGFLYFWKKNDLFCHLLGSLKRGIIMKVICIIYKKKVYKSKKNYKILS
jgi:hypothetical protein